MLTTEQRDQCQTVAQMYRGDGDDQAADAIDAALATIDEQAAELADVKAARATDVATLARALTELALLRRVAEAVLARGLADCSRFQLAREWRAQFRLAHAPDCAVALNARHDCSCGVNTNMRLEERSAAE